MSSFETDGLAIFNDIDWFIFEDPSTAFWYKKNTNNDTVSLEPLPVASRDLVVVEEKCFPNKSTVEMVVPGSRHQERYFKVRVPVPCTLWQLMNVIYNFYMIPLELDFLKYKKIDNGYYKDALKKLERGINQTITSDKTGVPVFMYELLGIKGIGPDAEDINYEPGQPRRHPLFCNGLVRVEKLSIKKSFLKLRLGS